VQRKLVGASQNETLALNYRPDPQEDIPSFFVRVARDVADQLNRQREEAMTRRTMSGNASGHIMIVTPYTTMASWMDVRSRLLKLAFVDKLEMVAISPQQADAILHYRGTEDALMKAIIALNLRVTPQGSYWVVSRD
jgi:hypothetical protein